MTNPTSTTAKCEQVNRTAQRPSPQQPLTPHSGLRGQPMHARTRAIVTVKNGRLPTTEPAHSVTPTASSCRRGGLQRTSSGRHRKYWSSHLSNSRSAARFVPRSTAAWCGVGEWRLLTNVSAAATSGVMNPVVCDITRPQTHRSCFRAEIGSRLSYRAWVWEL